MVKKHILKNSEHISPGFTLVELMVVITILGIMAVMVIPNFAGMQQRARMRAGAQEIAQDFRQPAGQMTEYWLGQSGGGLYFGTSGLPAAGPAEAGANPIPADGWGFANGVLYFQARGAATQGVAYVTNGRDDYAVGVNRLGKVRVYQYSGGQWNTQ